MKLVSAVILPTALLAAILVAPPAYAQSAASAQGAVKPKIAVYATGGKGVDENMVIGTKILAALIKDGRYLPVERMEAFIAELNKEQRTQMSGAVDEREITRLGKHFGVQFVCIANITEVFGTNLVSARIVNVETAEVVAMGTAGSPLKTSDDLATATERVTTAMFASSGGRGASKIAVYTTGAQTVNENSALGTEMLSELVKRGAYRAVERSNAFLAEVAREQLAQQSGAVDESQISRLGRQFGVQYVCVADITRAFGSNLVSARIIDVEKAEVVAIGKTQSPLASLYDLTYAAAQVAGAMSAAPAEKGAEKIAVYVTGVKNVNESKAFGTEMLYELVRDGMYRAVERSNAFVAEIAREQAKQHSGAIDDNQILALGKQFGTRFVCIADVRKALGTTLVSARVINVETAVVVAIGVTEPKVSSLDGLSAAAAAVVNEIYRQVKGKPRQSELVAQQQKMERDEQERQERIAREERERRDEEERQRARLAMEKAEEERRQKQQKEEEERARLAEKDRRAEEAARQKEWAAKGKKERRKENRVKRGIGVGAGFAYQPALSGITWQSENGDLRLITDSFDWFVFLDAAYVYVTASISSGGQRWAVDEKDSDNKPKYKAPYDPPVASNVSSNIGAYLKCPIVRSYGANDGASIIYPVVGVEYQFPISAEIKSKGSSGEKYTIDAESLSALWYRVGAGAEVVGPGGGFGRIEGLFGFRKPNEFEQAGTIIGEWENMKISSSCLGLSIKVALGKKF
ncbi:MAG: CsgG/HfaB family protein [Chitinispirillales bacterium]|jgi:TolB-like protein|nr:CsgG/HfaB family protein [Chitinispirillales bacterium]